MITTDAFSPLLPDVQEVIANGIDMSRKTISASGDNRITVRPYDESLGYRDTPAYGDAVMYVIEPSVDSDALDPLREMLQEYLATDDLILQPGFRLSLRARNPFVHASQRPSAHRVIVPAFRVSQVVLYDTDFLPPDYEYATVLQLRFNCTLDKHELTLVMLQVKQFVDTLPGRKPSPVFKEGRMILTDRP